MLTLAMHYRNGFQLAVAGTMVNSRHSSAGLCRYRRRMVIGSLVIVVNAISGYFALWLTL